MLKYTFPSQSSIASSANLILEPSLACEVRTLIPSSLTLSKPLAESQTMIPPSLDSVTPIKVSPPICFQFSQFPFLSIRLIQPSRVAVYIVPSLSTQRSSGSFTCPSPSLMMFCNLLSPVVVEGFRSSKTGSMGEKKRI
ncbi:hypothetical protein V8G54_007743 [Vigna mungo]|uniref:Uncharacterized protein n=1 Tax=Vigna mungo TaxID=3915 RepID=A0AAQ3P3X7_VIGMU